MRHRLKTKKLNRKSKHREALFKNLIRELFIHGEITTTEAKAKVVKPIAEKLVTRAKKQDISSRRLIQAYFNDRDVTIRLFDQMAPQLSNRTSGYTRLQRVGIRRGDDAILVKLSLVDRIVEAETKAPSKEVTEQS